MQQYLATVPAPTCINYNQSHHICCNALVYLYDYPGMYSAVSAEELKASDRVNLHRY
jgi:hypothetical protein